MWCVCAGRRGCATFFLQNLSVVLKWKLYTREDHSWSMQATRECDVRKIMNLLLYTLLFFRWLVDPFKVQNESRSWAKVYNRSQSWIKKANISITEFFLHMQVSVVVNQVLCFNWTMTKRSTIEDFQNFKCQTVECQQKIKVILNQKLVQHQKTVNFMHLMP